MQSNFEFLNKNELTQPYYNRSVQSELSYAMGLYSNVLTNVRTIAENVARDVADQNFLNVDNSTFNDVISRLKKGAYIDKYASDLFYDIKGPGNVAAHTLNNATQKEALDSLKNLYALFVWFLSTVYDEKIDITAFNEPVKEDMLYQTTSYTSNSEKNLIYIQTADNSKGNFPAYIGNQKVGKTGVGDLAEDNSDNSPYLRDWATKRINQYMNTSGIPFKLEWAELAYRKSDGWWFSDHDVHRVLERSGVEHSKNLTGDEWFKTDLETAKRAIKAVKENKDSISINANTKESSKIILRPEQKDAVEKTVAGFKTGKKMLWNAKMRFGKTLTALELIKEQKYKKVLIMTHRPVVNDGWFKDFRKIGMPEAGYHYGSKTYGDETIESLEKEKKPYVYFASIQDLAGSEAVGGKVSDKNRDLFNVDWDLVIVDEAHEGTQTELTQNVLDLLLKKHTKQLDLSGTPFNILSEYDEDHVYTWDYTMEQEAKQKWYQEHPNTKNPYEGLPKVSMFTFEMNKNFSDPRFNDINLGKPTFNFKEFFRTDQNGKFVYEDDVRRFLDNITNPGKNNYPFSTRQFRRNLRHTLWVLPGIKEANALEDLLKEHPIFGKEYKILNVVRGDRSDQALGTENDAEAERKQIAEADKEGLNTVTLTVRKLTTGTTIPEWTGVLFLSNISSAMQYLQAAFRAQTPYSSPKFGKKENCYIFDFAPDRALNIMAESTSLSTGVGKIQTKEQRERMTKLMNFLPILGEENQGMKPFKVDTLLTHIKRAYAEKAVRTGFDDDSIYSDELLMIKEEDLQQFNQLKEIIGTTRKDQKPEKFDVNHQGLDEEEYDTAEKARKKKRRERTQEEQDAIDKVKALKKQRRTMISILRGISIRIPLMIYGMDINFDEEVSIQKFVNNIDDASWQEFMPMGVSKEVFKQFVRYYDADVFIEAGKIIRQRVKDLDKVDPLERVDKLADIFATFRNPDKETVLTPWRVVNMHLGKTIGGLSFYDKDFKEAYENGAVVRRWISTEYTDKVLNRDARILEINSKTGLYPLYITTSIYWHEFQKMNEQKAGKFNYEDELLLWQRILRENIYLVAKTPMAKDIAIRTLIGYHSDWITDVNAEYVENIIDDSKLSVSKEAQKIEGLFGNMKFDAIIGNPPYQNSDGGAQASATPIYNEFVDLARNMDTDLITLIIPSRWYTGGKGLNSFRKSMLQDKHIKTLFDFKDPQSVFPHTNIRGGICIFLWDRNFDNTEKGTEIITVENGQEVAKSYRALNSLSLGIFMRDSQSFGILEKVRSHKDDSFMDIVSVRQPFGLSGTFIKSKYFFSDASNLENPIKVYGKGTTGYTSISEITKNREWINKVKVFTARANNIGTELNDDNLNAFVGRKGTASTETYLAIGADLNLTEKEAHNIVKYLRTKFLRYLVSLSKSSQDAPRSTYRFVPLQDFTDESNIDWTLRTSEIDKQLYKKYDLSSDEISFIESKMKAM